MGHEAYSRRRDASITCLLRTTRSGKLTELKLSRRPASIEGM
jgi:hypothetical protein